MQFANGVVLAPDESFVLVAETGGSRINRVWLKGPQKGRQEVFADDLPGMPDNMSLGTDGLFWVALPSPSDARLKLVHRLPVMVRRMLARIPEELQPPELRSVLVMAFNADGQCVHFIEGGASALPCCHGRSAFISATANASPRLTSRGRSGTSRCCGQCVIRWLSRSDINSKASRSFERQTAPRAGAGCAGNSQPRPLP